MWIKRFSVRESTQSGPAAAACRSRGAGDRCSCHEASLIVLPALNQRLESVRRHQSADWSSQQAKPNNEESSSGEASCSSHLAHCAMRLPAGRATALAGELPEPGGSKAPTVLAWLLLFISLRIAYEYKLTQHLLRASHTRGLGSATERPEAPV